MLLLLYSIIKKKYCPASFLRYLCLLCLLINFTISSKNSFAQNKLQFEHLSLEDGLSHNTILSICQDKRGYMWFGTSYGLNQYDGYEFKTFRHNPMDSTSIDHNYVTTIFEDSKERLWVGTLSGLNCFDRKLGIFKHYPITTASKNEDVLEGINKIIETKDGTLWLTTNEVLKEFNPDNNQFSIYIPKDEAGNYLGEISELFEDTRQNLWVGTKAGIRLFDRKQKKFTNPLNDFNENKSNNVRFFLTMVEDLSGNLWVASRGDGVRKYDIRQDKWQLFQHSPNEANSLSNNFINGITIDEQNNLWIASGRSGLDYFNQKTGTFLNYRQNPLIRGSLNNNSLNVLYIDQTQGLWIGTWLNGLNYLKQGNQFQHYKSEVNPNSLSSNLITGISGDKQGNLWVSTDDSGGLNYINRQTGKIKRYTIPKKFQKDIHGWQSIKSMLVDRDGTLWMGTLKGLIHFDPLRRKWDSYVHHPKDNTSLSAGIVTSILQDFQGNIWVGTRGGGLNKLNRITKKFTTYNYQATSISDFGRIRYLYEDRAGLIWVCTFEKGLISFDSRKGKFTQLETLADQNGNTNIGINVVYEDNQHQLWIGTHGSGLKIWNQQTNEILSLTEKDGLAGNLVFGILEDDNNLLWISTNKGISAYDSKKSTFTNYDKHDGLQGNQFLTNAFYKTPKGELCFGGINGLNIFHPDQLSTEVAPIPVQITDFYLFNQPITVKTEDTPLKEHISYSKKITLNHQQSVFSFQYAAINYTAPQNNHYAYRLTPLEKEWNIAGNRRFTSYSNLPAGTYTFEVKASNSDHFTNDACTSIKLQILPKPWLTWWAYSLYFLGLCIIFWWIRSYEISKLRMKNELKLEKLNRLQKEELYQAKMKFFTNISHEFRTPLTLIISPIEKLLSNEKISPFLKNQYQLIYRNSQQLQRLINQLLDFRKIEMGELKLNARQGDIIQFTQNIALLFKPLAEQKQIHLSFQSKISNLAVWCDWDKLEKILNNLIGNALKFTPKKGTISIQVKETMSPPLSVQISILDNGCGIPAGKLPRIFDRFFQAQKDRTAPKSGSGIGLAFAKELVEMHRGTLTVQSKEGKGSIFKINLPLGKAHLNPNEITDKVKAREKTTKTTVISKAKKFQPIPSENKKMATLLIVDDSEDILNLLKNYLADQYRILEASNGKEAWTIAQEQLPDLIISDVMMPIMDGKKLCYELKSNLETSHIPVILLTALNTLEHRIKGIETGADAYIPKPFNIDFLSAKVNSLVKQRQQLKKAFTKALKIQPKAFSPSLKDEEFIHKVIQVIDNRLDDSEFDMEDLLSAMNSSHSTMYRKLKVLTDLSGNEFIRSIRLKRGAAMLHRGQMNISEIAYQVGFSDPKYFSTCFKKAFGMSPSQYKNSDPEVPNISLGKSSSDSA